MRASRLVSTLHLLQTRGRMTADALAEALEVSVRTVYRDIEALGAAGIPVYGVAGKQGGYALVDGYRTRLTGLAAPEAASLFLMGAPAAAADLGYAEALSAAKLKLLSSLPDAVRTNAQMMEARFLLDAPPWYQDHERPLHLTAIANAVWTQRRLRIGYTRWARPRNVSARVDPLGLVLKAGQWYLVAGTSNGLRTYRISRVTTVVELEEPCKVPREFDLRRYWQLHLREFDERRHVGTATLRMAQGAVEEIPHRLEPTVARAAVASVRRTEEDGWVYVDMPIESLEHAAAVILQFGASVEVVAPPALRQCMRREVHELARRYA